MVTETIDEPSPDKPTRDDGPRLALVVVHASDPRRIGDVLFPTLSPAVIGRGDEGGDELAAIVRQRPGTNEPRPALDLPALSRRQCEISLVARGEGIVVRNLGRRRLLDGHGSPSDEVRLAPGETFEIEGQLAFVCTSRPAVLPRAREAATSSAAHTFGEVDEHGFVGESPTMWQLREHVAFIAGRAAHVLVLGPSGAGKEVVAQAIHALSKRGKKSMVARSAVTIPEGIADAELFGNLANYPNPGTPERKGLVGEADGTTLFLDELGELPEELQARLLRVLDERGEYQRLGEARVRRSDLRLVAATNRPTSALKHDVAARFRMRLTVPGLDERREDIPLLARHILRRVARTDDDIARRFFDERGEPRLSFPLVRALVGHTYRTHVRELETLLWIALGHAKDGTADLCPELVEELSAARESAPKRGVDTVTEDEVRAALERHQGVQDRAYKELGLANRFVLQRLMKRWGIKAK
jgi:DNA-binding NtrC family response regulator